jgi:hypothetical protein
MKTITIVTAEHNNAQAMYCDGELVVGRSDDVIYAEEIISTAGEYSVRLEEKEVPKVPPNGWPKHLVAISPKKTFLCTHRRAYWVTESQYVFASDDKEAREVFLKEFDPDMTIGSPVWLMSNRIGSITVIEQEPRT